ncbi:agmatinase [Candidatus Woesearchaeota archaeon]|nr:agmatinase [Candidatus Woesearchaeota archaeon]
MVEKLNFGGMTGDYSDSEKSRFVIVPVPFDKTSTWQKGAAKGPKAIIEASYYIEPYNIETDSEAYLLGIHTDKPIKATTSEGMVNAVEKRVLGILLRGQYPILFGGEHSVSIGAVKAFSKHSQDIGKKVKFTVLQLDAHSDMRDEFEDSKLNHACTMSRIKEYAPIVQVGIRSMDSLEPVDRTKSFFAMDIHHHTKWYKKAIDLCEDDVYVTIDLDVFDPSIMPSTGTPEPGGLGWYQVIEFLGKLAEERNIIGFDVCELCPIEGLKAPDFMAAKLVYNLMSYVHK